MGIVSDQKGKARIWGLKMERKSYEQTSSGNRNGRDHSDRT